MFAATERFLRRARAGRRVAHKIFSLRQALRLTLFPYRLDAGTVAGFDQITVPGGSGPAKTVISADAVPAVTVTCPAASAVSSDGSSVERLTMVGSLDALGNCAIGDGLPLSLLGRIRSHLDLIR